MTGMPSVTEPVTTLSGSMRMLLLPDIAAKLAVGWKALRVPEGVSVLRTQEDAVIMSEEDFDLCRKVAERITASGLSPVDPGGIIEACSMARKMIAEEIFRPGAARVLFYPSLTQASAFYRCLQPCLALNKGGLFSSFVSKARVAREAVDYDAVVIQIDHSPAALRFASALKAMGKKVVFEIDDAFDQLEPWHPRYETYRHADVQAAVFRMMELADAVTVPTEYLARRYASRGNLVVLPNMIDVSGWPAMKPNLSGSFRILWAGSPSHGGDLAVITEALAEVHRRHADIRFVFFGHLPGKLAEALEGSANLVDFVPFEAYPNRYAELAADLVLAPLADVPFNHAKSPLRLLEAGAAGVPAVASAVGTYAQVTGIPLCRSTGDWVEAIEALHADGTQRAVVGVNTRIFACQYDLFAPKSVERVERIFSDVIGR